MELYEQGKQYWTIARRFHANRGSRMIRDVACREMTRMLQDCKSGAVGRRAATFLTRNLPKSPPQNDGPRFA